MGWDFGLGHKKADAIEHCTKDWTTIEGQKHTCITHTVKDNILWAVWEDETDIGSERIIVCSLLRDDHGYGWGHKSIPESSHPYYYSCPEEYLALAPVACEKWRAKVREFHHA